MPDTDSIYQTEIRRYMPLREQIRKHIEVFRALSEADTYGKEGLMQRYILNLVNARERRALEVDDLHALYRIGAPESPHRISSMIDPAACRGSEVKLFQRRCNDQLLNGALSGIPIAVKATSAVPFVPDFHSSPQGNPSSGWQHPVGKGAADVNQSKVAGLMQSLQSADADLDWIRMLSLGALPWCYSAIPESAMGGNSFQDGASPPDTLRVVGNPINSQLSAGGSSGGAAASVQTGVVAWALGSDYGGSLRNPAAQTQGFSYCPRGPRSGFGSVTGPMTSTADDLSVAMDAFTGIGSERILSLGLAANVKSLLNVGGYEGIPAIAEHVAKCHVRKISLVSTCGVYPTSDLVTNQIQKSLQALSDLCIFEPTPDQRLLNLFRVEKGTDIRLGSGAKHVVQHDVCLGDIFDILRMAGSVGINDGPCRPKPEKWWNEHVFLNEPDRPAVAKIAKGLQEHLVTKFHETLADDEILVMPVLPFPAWPKRLRYVSRWAGMMKRACSYLECLSLLKPATTWQATVITAQCEPLRKDDVELPVGVQLITKQGQEWRALAIAQLLEERHLERPARRLPRTPRETQLPAEWLQVDGPDLADWGRAEADHAASVDPDSVYRHFDVASLSHAVLPSSVL